MNIDLSAAADSWRCVPFFFNAILTILTLYSKFINDCLDDKAVQKFPQERQFDVPRLVFAESDKTAPPHKKSYSPQSSKNALIVMTFFSTRQNNIWSKISKLYNCTRKPGKLHLVSWLAGMFFTNVQANSRLTVYCITKANLIHQLHQRSP